MEESNMLQSQPVSLKSNKSVTNNENVIDTTTDDLSDEILDEITPMLFSMPADTSNENDQ
jgi:hypothetical protein